MSRPTVRPGSLPPFHPHRGPRLRPPPLFPRRYRLLPVGIPPRTLYPRRRQSRGKVGIRHRSTSVAGSSSPPTTPSVRKDRSPIRTPVPFLSLFQFFSQPITLSDPKSANKDTHERMTLNWTTNSTTAAKPQSPFDKKNYYRERSHLLSH